MAKSEIYHVMLIDTKENTKGELEIEVEDATHEEVRTLFQTGNFSCDCNRSILLYKDALEEPKWDRDWGDHALECEFKENVIKVALMHGDDVLFSDYDKIMEQEVG